MGRRKNKKNRNRFVKEVRKTEGNSCFLQFDNLDLHTEKTNSAIYFLGFKRKNFNELWKWDTLEDVNFDSWRKQ